MTIGSETRFTA